VLLVPTFAVGRTQALLHLLADLTVAGRIPAVPTFLNSPMGIAATQAFLDHPEAHRLSRSACEALADRATFVRDVEESKALNRRGGPMILIAGSGMATGGRILHHLEAFGPDPNNGILLVGYQAAGTRGEAIASGAPDVKIHGEQIPIRAERFEIDALSGHADWRELVDWVRGTPEPRKVLLNHGEPTAAEALARHLQEELGWRARVAGEETVDV
jgi:metallo-beta-lactamase family protein